MRALRTSHDPADPIVSFAQFRKRAQVKLVSLPCLHPAYLNYDCGVRRSAQFGPGIHAIRFSKYELRRSHRAIHHLGAKTWSETLQRTFGKAAVADGQVGPGKPRPAIQPVAAVAGVVTPGDQGHAGGSDNRAEYRLGPRHMTDHRIEVALAQEVRQAPARLPNAKRMPGSHRPQPMYRHARLGEFAAQPPLETDREFGLHRGAQIPETRQRHQQRLDPAVEIARRYVQNPHRPVFSPRCASLRVDPSSPHRRSARSG